MKTILTFISLIFSMIMVAQKPTIREIYHFEVGDIFHYQHDMHGKKAGYYSISNIKIMQKYFSASLDTVFYVRDLAIRQSGSSIPTVTYFKQDTIWYTDLDSLINKGKIDSIYSDISLYNGRKIYRDTSNFLKLFVYSLGLVDNIIYADYVSLILNEEKLIYYKRGSESWGLPVWLSIDQPYSNLPSLKIYPNPVINELHFSPDKEYLIHTGLLQILDLQGKTCKEFKIYSIQNENSFNIQNLRTGIYFIKYSMENGECMISKFVKE